MNATTVRDALVALLDERMIEWKDSAEDVADAILALVRPVAGIVLSPEEAHRAAPPVRYAAERWEFIRQEDADEMRALATRLEAAQ